MSLAKLLAKLGKGGEEFGPKFDAGALNHSRAKAALEQLLKSKGLLDDGVTLPDHSALFPGLGKEQFLKPKAPSALAKFLEKAGKSANENPKTAGFIAGAGGTAAGLAAGSSLADKKKKKRSYTED